MEQYPKTYEDVFSSDHIRNPARLNLDHISVSNGMDLNEYINLSRDFLTDFYSSFFDNAVKLSWLRLQFSYSGEKSTLQMKNNSPRFCVGFSKFVRRIVGKDVQPITKSRIFPSLETYFLELFPLFVEENPFKNPEYYKFPFKNISLDFLPLVSKMDDRLELLKIADERKMTYSKFIDYVINHISSINEKLGRERYRLMSNRGSSYVLVYIRDLDKLPVRARRKK